MAYLIWPIFLLLFGFSDESCRFLGQEYDPEEHTFLCTHNETVAEKYVEETLAKAEDKEDFDSLAESLGESLMTNFRDEVSRIFEKFKCSEKYCNPRELTEIEDHQSLPRFGLEIDRLQLLQIVDFEREINDLVVTHSFQTTYVTVAHVTGDPVIIMNYIAGTLLVSHFLPFPGSCLVSTNSRFWTPHLTISGSCHPEDVSVRQYKRNSTYVYVFSALSKRVEMTQAIEVNIERISALQVTWQRGTPSLLVFGKEFGLQHNWDNYNFQLTSTAILPEAYDVSTFQIADATYIVLSKFTKTLDPRGVYIYQSLRNHPGSYHLYQRLTICEPTDTEYFSISNLHFLAVACQGNFAYIYWWSGSQFLLWQRIESSNPASWSTIRLVNREIILALVEYRNHFPVLRFFQLEDEYFHPINVEIPLHRHFKGRRVKITSFNHLHDTILLVTGKLHGQVETNQKPPNYWLHNEPNIAKQPKFEFDGTNKPLLMNSILVFKLHLRPRHQPQLPQVESENNIRSCLSKLSQKMDTEKILIDELNSSPSDWMVIDKRQVVTGGKTLTKGLYAEDVVVDKLYLAPSVILEVEKDFKCEECERQEFEFHNKLDQLLAESEDLVLRNEKQIITGKKIITNNLVVQEKLHSEHVFIGQVCSIDLNRLNSTMVTKTGNQIFKNDITFYGDISTLNIDFLGLVNGIQLQNIATLSGPRHFTAVQTFTHLTVNSAEIIGTINDIRPHDIVIQDIPQEIHGSKTIIGNLIVKGSLNVKEKFYGVDVQDLAKNILTTNTVQHINADVTFENVVFAHKVNARSLLDVDLNEFYHNVLNTHEPQTITGQTNFASDVIVNGNVDLMELNGVDFHRDVVTTNSYQLIPSEVTIVGDVTIRGDLTTDTRINGLDFAHDVVTVNKAQDITGRKTFLNTVHAIDIEVPHGLVNGIDLSHVAFPVAASTRHVKIDELQAEVINGKSVHDLMNVLKKNAEQQISGTFIFNDVTLNNIYVHGLISGRQVDQDFVTVSTEQILQQQVIFDEEVEVHGSLSLKDKTTINNIDLSIIEMNAVTVDGDQEIGGRKIFEKEVHVKENVLVQHGVKINDIDLSEQLFLINKEQIIQNNFFAEEIVIHDDAVFSGYVNTTTINDVNVDNFFEKVVYVEGEYELTGVKTFTSDVEVYNQLNVNLINGYDVKKLENRIVRLSNDQIITGQVVVNGTLQLEATTEVDTINGVNVTEEISRLVHVENGKVNSPVHFEKCVKFEDEINVVTINHFDVETTLRNIFSKSKPQNLNGARHIDEHVVIHNLITPRVDGIAMEEILLTSETTLLQTPIIFHQNLEVTGDLSIDVLNDVRVDDIFTKSVVTGRDTIIRGTKTFSTINAKVVNIDGFVNGVNFTQLPRRLVLRDEIQEISANVVFETDIVVNEFNTSGPINDVDLNLLLKTAMTKTGSQTIFGRKVFSTAGHQQQSIIAEDVVEIEDIQDVGLIHGVDLVLVSSEAILQHETQVITQPIVFTSKMVFNQIHLRKTINNLRIPEDIALTNRDQYIHGTVTFSPINVTDLEVMGKVNNVNLTRLINRRITMTTDQVIERPIVFERFITITGDIIVRGRINNLKCDEIVTTSTDQEITGPKSFIDIEAPEGVSTDFINDVHWLVLYNQVEQLVNRKWIHQEDVIFENEVILVGRLSSDDEAEKQANQLKNEAEDYRQKITQYAIDYEKWRLTSCQCLGQMAPQMSSLAHYVDYFQLVQSFESSIDAAAIPFGRNLFLLLLESPNLSKNQNCHNLITYKCPNLPNEPCKPEHINPNLPIQNARSIDFFPGQKILFLAVQNRESRGCPSTSTGIFIVAFIDENMIVFRLDDTLADAIAILPGHPKALVATAKFGRVEVRLMTCNHTNCLVDANVMSSYSLNGARVISLTWYAVRGTYYLFVLNSAVGLSGSEQVLSVVLRWQDTVLVKAHQLSTTSPTDVVYFVENGQVYFAIGSYDYFNDINANKVRIYKLGRIFELVQEIDISAYALSVHNYLGETYLMVSHVERDVFVYRWRGFFGFQFWSRIEIVRPHKTENFTFKGKLFTVISGNDYGNRWKTSKSMIVMGQQTDFAYNSSIPHFLHP